MIQGSLARSAFKVSHSTARGGLGNSFDSTSGAARTSEAGCDDDEDEAVREAGMDKTSTTTTRASGASV